MKKLFLVALLVYSLFTLAACGDNGSTQEILNQQATTSNETAQTDTAAATPQPAEEPDLDVTPEPEQEQQEQLIEEMPDWGEHAVIVNGIGLAPMYNFFTLDGELLPTHVPLFPVLSALGLSDTTAGSQIDVQNHDGEFITELHIVNYRDDGGIIDMYAVGIDDVFMAQNWGVYAPLSFFREMGFSVSFLDDRVFIEADVSTAEASESVVLPDTVGVPTPFTGTVDIFNLDEETGGAFNITGFAEEFPDVPRFSRVEDSIWMMFRFEAPVRDVVFVSIIPYFDERFDLWLYELGETWFEAGDLDVRQPILIQTIGHFGTLPAQAIGFTYADGVRYYIPFDESQMDGSLVLHKWSAFTFNR